MSKIFEFIHQQNEDYKTKLKFGDHWLEPGSDLLVKFPQYASEYKTPSRAFEKLLKPFKNLQEFIKERKDKGSATHVMDLFGSGNFIDDFSSVDSITTGVRVSDIASSEEKAKRPEKFKVLGGGSIYADKIWIDINEHMRDNGIPSFDVVVCRPGGAFRFENHNKFAQDDYLKIFYILLRRTYSLLSNNNGVIFTETPNVLKPNAGVEQPVIFQNTIDFWINHLKQKGIDVEHDNYKKFKITKTKNAPAKFPLFEYTQY